MNAVPSLDQVQPKSGPMLATTLKRRAWFRPRDGVFLTADLVESSKKDEQRLVDRGRVKKSARA